MGVSLLGDDEIRTLKAACVVELRDLDLGMVGQALAAFEVAPEWDALAVAVFDHGEAPPRYSDRKFRFEHLRRQVIEGKREVKSFCYLRHEVPVYMTRMLAVTQSVDEDIPLLVMDSAEATVLGALEDRYVASQRCKVVVNVGNEHTLAFHLHHTAIQGIFEHHTHLLTRTKLESYLRRLALGNLDDEEVWLDQGHGAVAFAGCEEVSFLAVTGPLRHLLEGSTLRPYFATPHGDMMLAGAFGLVRAWAEKHEGWRQEITNALRTN